MKAVQISGASLERMAQVARKLAVQDMIRIGVDADLGVAKHLTLRGFCIRAGDYLIARPWLKYAAAVMPDALSNPEMYRLVEVETTLPRLLLLVLQRFSRETTQTGTIREAVLWYVDSLVGLERTGLVHRIRDVVLGEVAEKLDSALTKLVELRSRAESGRSITSADLDSVLADVALARQRLRSLLESR